MKRLILLLPLLLLFIGIVQNSQPINLVFFGFEIARELPLSVWILIFIAAGALTSLSIQLLLNLTSPKIAAKVNKTQTPPPSSSSRTYYDPSDRDRKKKRPRSQPIPEPVSYSNSNTAEPTKSSKPNNETIADDFPPEDNLDWKIEEPPSRSTTVEKFDPTLEKYKSTVFEAQQQPENVSRSGSIYSYTYKKATQRDKSEPTNTAPPSPDRTPTSRDYTAPPSPDRTPTPRDYTSATSSADPSPTPRDYTPPPSPDPAPTSRDYTPPPSPDPSPTPSDRQNPEEYYPQSSSLRSDRVYDAKYRVITPPYRDLPLEDLDRDDDEDWI